MGRLIFCLGWTLLATWLAAAAMDSATPSERAVFLLFPLFGLLSTWLVWTRLRRRRSLRTETVAGCTVYFWIEWNGREARSETDPRPEWDEADGDGDGDGGGD